MDPSVIKAAIFSALSDTTHNQKREPIWKETLVRFIYQSYLAQIQLGKVSQSSECISLNSIIQVRVYTTYYANCVKVRLKHRSTSIYNTSQPLR